MLPTEFVSEFNSHGFKSEFSGDFHNDFAVNSQPKSCTFARLCVPSDHQPYKRFVDAVIANDQSLVETSFYDGMKAA